MVGISANNNAVFGDSSAAGNGVFARTVNGIGLVAQAAGAGSAASFFGNVVVNGSFTVVGGTKSGAVKFPDGSVRRLYSTETPESWFDGYGEAKLDGGRASVPIPSDFANAVNLTVPYHVFLTPHLPELERWP